MLTQVADGVLVHRSEILQNNTVVVRGEAGALLVDPGITSGEMSCLARDLAELGQPAAAGFATHPDWDHVLWQDDLGDVPRYGTARCAAFMRSFRSDPKWREHAEQALPPEVAGETPLELFGLITALPDGNDWLAWDGPRIRIIEHRAHAQGHAALLVEEAGVLIAGDMLSDLFVPMLDFDDDADPIEDYLAALRLFESVAGGAGVVVPGHGTASSGQLRERIEQDRAYVLALRDGKEPDDPRVGSGVRPGWEWVVDIHTGQAQTYAEWARSRG